jgi:glycerol-3-phosphate acyltransferase PlsY
LSNGIGATLLPCLLALLALLVRWSVLLRVLLVLLVLLTLLAALSLSGLLEFTLALALFSFFLEDWLLLFAFWFCLVLMAVLAATAHVTNAQREKPFSLSMY